MKLKDIAKELGATVEAAPDGLANEVTGGYVGDLLSCVMARARHGNVWVTVHAHPNIVAVATLVGLAGIIVAERTVVDPVTIRRANEEGVTILTSARSSFTVVAALVHMGLEGPY